MSGVNDNRALLPLVCCDPCQQLVSLPEIDGEDRFFLHISKEFIILIICMYTCIYIICAFIYIHLYVFGPSVL